MLAHTGLALRTTGAPQTVILVQTWNVIRLSVVYVSHFLDLLDLLLCVAWPMVVARAMTGFPWLSVIGLLYAVLSTILLLGIGVLLVLEQSFGAWALGAWLALLVQGPTLVRGVYALSRLLAADDALVRVRSDVHFGVIVALIDAIFGFAFVASFVLGEGLFQVCLDLALLLLRLVVVIEVGRMVFQNWPGHVSVGIGHLLQAFDLGRKLTASCTQV